MFTQAQQPKSSSQQRNRKEEYIDYIDKAKKKLIALLKLREKLTDGNTIYHLISNFNSYISSSTEIFPYYRTNDNQYAWVQIKSKVKGFEDISDIALRLLGSATSEASCERSIKKQRLIHNKRRLKSTKELLDVRMIHNSLP